MTYVLIIENAVKSVEYGLTSFYKETKSIRTNVTNTIFAKFRTFIEAALSILCPEKS